jgi:hypothetical protein
MGRPIPIILLNEYKVPTKEVRILASEAYYYVVYKNKPFNPLEVDKDPRKFYNKKRYITNGWAHRGHADRLAAKLNKLFNTTEFTVKEIKGE